MALADPQPLVIGSSTANLNRISSGSNTSTYQSDDGSTKLTISHNYAGKRNRRLVRLDNVGVTEDPYNPSSNVPRSMSVYIVVDVPKLGFNTAEQTLIFKALAAYLSADDYAVIPKLLGGQS